ncbi:MAG TPA: hypothetical protein V6C96_03175, partial [Vampirovibrionales bacterium]
DPDGSIQLLELFDKKPQSYQKFANDYYQEELPLESIQLIYEHKPLNKDIVKSINPEVEFDELLDDLKEIGYPSLK